MAATAVLASLLASSTLGLPQHYHYGQGAVAAQAFMPYYRAYRPFTAFNSVPSSGLRIAPTSRIAPALRIAPAGGSLVTPLVGLAEQVKASLRALPRYPGAQQYVDRVLSTSSCLSSLDEAIATIDTAVGAVVASEAEIVALVDQSRSLKNTKEATKLVAGAADLVETLAELLPKLAEPALEGPLCGGRVGAEKSFQEMRELAKLLDEVASAPGVQARKSFLEKSSRSIYATVSLLSSVRSTYANLGETCQNDNSNGKNSILALGTTIDDIADLFGVLGSISEAESIRKGGSLVKKIVADLAPLDGLSLWEVDCSQQTLAGTADNLRKLATTLEDKDIQEISKELGINLDFSSLGLY